MRSRLAEPARTLPRVLIAQEDAAALQSLADLFSGRYSITRASDGQKALDLLRAEDFDLAILDQHLPTYGGLEVVERLVLEDCMPPPFMFLSEQASAEVRVHGLALGAADFVMKPVDPDELLARVARIIAALQRERSLAADALSDPLTGLANYRALMRNLQLELERAQRYDTPLSLLTVDLDGLKSINDELGHPAGNDAIRLVASVLQGAVRRFETVARQGGDELAVLLPNTTEEHAMHLGERLRREVERRSICGRGLAVSIGVASREVGDPPMNARSLVEASDHALYWSKREGRNCVSGSRR
ncbi:MAG: GGDEF domain-containing response regulator [Polyangiaceae bacterium]